MVSEEVKETIYIAIGAIVAAAVLALLAFVLQLRGDYAATYNEQKATQLETEMYMKYNAYQDKIIYGDELIALIREFWDTDTHICIDEIVFKNSEGNTISNTYKGFLVNVTGVGDITDKVTVGSETWVYLNPINMKQITVNLNSLKSNSSALVYTLQDLQTGREGTKMTINGMATYGIDPNEAYYVCLVSNVTNGADLVSAKYSPNISYSSVNGIRIMHIPKSDYPSDIYENSSLGINMIVPKEKIKTDFHDK